MFTVSNYAFTIDGLSITYNNKGQTYTLACDSKATCELFQQVGIIEGFDIDKNNEPVILFTDDSYGRPAPGFCFWCDYVRTFRFIQRHAEIILESRENYKSFRETENRIKELLKPLSYVSK